MGAKQEVKDLVVYGAADLRRVLGIGRPNAYKLLRQLGRRVGRRLVVSRAVLEAWLASAPEGNETRREKLARRAGPRGRGR